MDVVTRTLRVYTATNAKTGHTASTVKKVALKLAEKVCVTNKQEPVRVGVRVILQVTFVTSARQEGTENTVKTVAVIVPTTNAELCRQAASLIVQKAQLILLV